MTSKKASKKNNEKNLPHRVVKMNLSPTEHPQTKRKKKKKKKQKQKQKQQEELHQILRLNEDTNAREQVFEEIHVDAAEEHDGGNESTPLEKEMEEGVSGSNLGEEEIEEKDGSESKHLEDEEENQGNETQLEGHSDSKNRMEENGSEETAKKVVPSADIARKFQRFFTEEDEIVILEGLINNNWAGAGRPLNVNGFCDSIRNSIHGPVTNTQLYEKIRRLKKRYENRVMKKKLVFKNAHETKSFELSRKIWGDQIKAEGKSTTQTETLSRINYLNGCEWGVEKFILNDGLKLITTPERLALEKKWKTLRMLETELYLKRLNLISEQTQLVLQSLNKPPPSPSPSPSPSSFRTPIPSPSPSPSQSSSSSAN